MSARCRHARFEHRGLTDSCLDCGVTMVRYVLAGDDTGCDLCSADAFVVDLGADYPDRDPEAFWCRAHAPADALDALRSQAIAL